MACGLLGNCSLLSLLWPQVSQSQLASGGWGSRESSNHFRPTYLMLCPLVPAFPCSSLLSHDPLYLHASENDTQSAFR